MRLPRPLPTPGPSGGDWPHGAGARDSRSPSRSPSRNASPSRWTSSTTSWSPRLTSRTTSHPRSRSHAGGGPSELTPREPGSGLGHCPAGRPPWARPRSPVAAAARRTPRPPRGTGARFRWCSSGSTRSGGHASAERTRPPAREPRRGYQRHGTRHRWPTRPPSCWPPRWRLWHPAACPAPGSDWRRIGACWPSARRDSSRPGCRLQGRLRQGRWFAGSMAGRRRPSQGPGSPPSATGGCPQAHATSQGRASRWPGRRQPTPRPSARRGRHWGAHCRQSATVGGWPPARG
ncbi:hypothetical protein H696_00065 [Fonticula alba]|uniref:Uncharacterized protein n=1 Tax=Fonticula alba TaxID=691883 RepID=A0A058ZDN7_FONAL|nr:hypothetical protein H696_00065 [Fonticula alba]KCV72469.1 hypothetical protein H696_00065 [Fonticula alba]|eukprot:XP_009492170.1 hypothetical protein H696_00065 [Fonticula alba]